MKSPVTKVQGLLIINEIMNATLPEHEHLFNEICDKLQELSHRPESLNMEKHQEQVERMHQQLRKSQEELKTAHDQIQERIRSLDTVAFSHNDIGREVKRLTEQLEQERIASSKLSTDLAKSLEMNLRLQFEVEEIRAKANQALTEERRNNAALSEKVKSLGNELDLSQALCNETPLEHSKNKDRFQMDFQTWQQEKLSLEKLAADQNQALHDRGVLAQKMQDELNKKEEEIKLISDSLLEFEAHTHQQTDVIKSLSEAAEKKMIELKMSLDRKTIECQDYYSHLQQSMSQMAVLRQENAALKDYIAKLTNLHQVKAQPLSQ